MQAYGWTRGINIKESHNRPGVAQRVPGGLAPRYS